MVGDKAQSLSSEKVLYTEIGHATPIAVAMVAAFPPPISGQSLAADLLAKGLESDGDFVVFKFDIAQPIAGSAYFGFAAWHRRSLGVVQRIDISSSICSSVTARKRFVAISS